MKQVICPNCSAVIETNNNLEVKCSVCEYIVKIPSETNENKKIKIKINS